MIDALTYLSCKHKQRDEEDEERDATHGLQVFQNTRPQRSKSNGDMWGEEGGGGGKVEKADKRGRDRGEKGERQRCGTKDISLEIQIVIRSL